MLVNLTALLLAPAHWTPQDAVGFTSVVSIPAVAEPEGVMVAPRDSRFVYLGGISSTALAVVDVTSFASPEVVEVRDGVGAQLVGATWKDQPLPLPSLDDDSGAFDPGLVFMAAWGINGGLVVLDTNDHSSEDKNMRIIDDDVKENDHLLANSSSSSAHPTEVARRTSLRLSEANRVKLAPWSWTAAETNERGDGVSAAGIAFMPLEREIGGFAAVGVPTLAQEDIEGSDDARNTTITAVPLGPLEIVHVPASEFTHDDVVSDEEVSLVKSTKAYCLALSAARYVYLFIAETASVYVYRFDGGGGLEGEAT